MPPVNLSDAYFLQVLRGILRRLNRLEQSFSGVKDANGVTRVKFGNTAGDNYGVAAYDNTGALRVQLGELDNGDYGLALTDADGNTQELLPMLDDYVDTSLSTTSTSPAPITGSPVVEAVIGASGDFEITCTSYIVTGAGDESAFVYLVIDGTFIGSILGIGSTTGSVAASCSNTKRWGPSGSGWSNAKGKSLLSPGPHSFALEYDTTSGTSCSFSSNYLKIQPL